MKIEVKKRMFKQASKNLIIRIDLKTQIYFSLLIKAM